MIMSEDFILNTLNAISHVNFVLVLKILAFILILFWVFVAIWVVNDAKSRSSSFIFVIISAWLVLFFNLLGLIIYFIIRPQATIEESRWAELEHRYLEFETAGLMSCPKCGFSLQPDFNICPQCGFEVKVECSNCESYIYKDWEFCPYCGKKNVKFVKNNMILNHAVKKSRKRQVEMARLKNGIKNLKERCVSIKVKVFKKKTKNEKKENKKSKKAKRVDNSKKTNSKSSRTTSNKRSLKNKKK